MNWLYSPRPARARSGGTKFCWNVRCDHCDGMGVAHQMVPGTENDWIPDSVEVYCDCEAGRWRRLKDGATDDEMAEWYAELLAKLVLGRAER